MREIEWRSPHRNRLYGSRDLGGGGESPPSHQLTSSRKPTSNTVIGCSWLAAWSEAPMPWAEFPIQLVGRVPHQLSGLPHDFVLCPTNFCQIWLFSGFKTNILQRRLAKLSDSKNSWQVNSCLPGFPRITISWHDILPHQLFPKSSTNGPWYYENTYTGLHG